MVSQKEMLSRIKEFFTFNKQEMSNLSLAAIIIAFIFSFCDWGEAGQCSGGTFSATLGFQHFALMLFVAGICVFFRVSCQKLYALSNGYTAEFRVWWTGMVISLVLTFLTLGRVPTVFLGGMVSVFMTRQRLGEFRYGHSYWQNGMISLWSVYAGLISAILFAVGRYAFPESYFFAKGFLLSLIMGWCALLPAPHSEGLNVFFAARWLYAFAIVLLTISTLLLALNNSITLIIAIVGGAVMGIFYLIIGSEK